MISLKNLPWRNLKGYAARTTALVIFSMLMAAAVFGGTMVIGGVRQGLDTVEARLGADIVVTPDSAKNDFDAQTVLVQAEPGYFYMDASKLEEVAAVPGVEKVSPQLFLASAAASCCSAKLQVIAFDPETDFTIQPWIADTFGDKELGLMDIIVGSNVTVTSAYTITLYGEDCHIAGQFAQTGSTLDNAVYMNFDTVKVLIRASIEKKLNRYDDLDADNVISSVMVRVEQGADIDAVAQEIQSRIAGTSCATSKSMVSGIGESLGKISRSITIFIAGAWAICLLLTVLLFTMMIHERRREFASLYAMGASRGIVTSIVTGEALTVNLLGGTAGIVVSGVLIAAFKGLIGQILGVGFVLPGIGTILLLALAALAAVMLAAVVSSRIAVRSISRLDAALVLKEGE